MPKLLFIWPMELPYDLTLHYHYTDFGEIAGYFIDKGYKVDIFDGGILAYLKKEYIKLLLNKYDFLVILSYIHNTHSAFRVAELCKEISPDTKTLIYGPTCYYVPKLLQYKTIDGFVCDGDWELGIQSFIEYHSKKSKTVRGVAIKENNYEFKKGELLNSKEWSFPPLDNLPLKKYFEIINQKEFVKNDGTKQISITVSRGCPFNCIFCKAPKIYGIKDRRRPVNKLIDFIEKNLEKFDIFQLFSPTFNVDNEWVCEFCNEVLRRNIKFKWKCTSRANLLEEKTVALMAKAGCYMVGLGVESLDPIELKEIKKFEDKKIVFKKIKLLKKYNIIPKAYIMVGIPSQTRKSLFTTIKTLVDAGAKIRPSAYSPYHLLNKNSTIKDLRNYNRYTINTDKIKGLTKKEVLNILFKRSFKDVC